MPGTFAFVGGAEFGKACDAADRLLVDLAGGPLLATTSRGAAARVGIFPTAAARENPRLAAQNGVSHFGRLGARAQAVMIVSRQDALAPELASRLDELSMVYLAGGDPIYLVETLQGTAAWQGMLALVERGGVLAGSSAGAMALGGQVWEPGEGWRNGLGAVPQIAVLPHHATLSARWNAERMRSTLPPGSTLVGLDECTALIGHGRTWKVLGPGEVTVYREGGAETFQAEQVVNL